MKIDYKAYFKGYIRIFRCVQLLLGRKGLSFAELGAYLCFLMQADFDDRHRNYGYLLPDDKELASKFHFHESTIYRQRKNLIKQGLLIEEANGNTKIVNPKMLFGKEFKSIMASGPPKNLVNLLINQELLSKNESDIAKTQNNQVQNDTQSFNNSFKDDLGLSEGEIEIPDDFQ